MARFAYSCLLGYFLFLPLAHCGKLSDYALLIATKKIELFHCSVLLLFFTRTDIAVGQHLVNVLTAPQGSRTNLTDLVNQRLAGNDGVPLQVMALLETLEGKPVCHQVATHQLITSCQSITEDTLNPRPSLDDLEKTKSIFAARLALCELAQANANSPSQCKPLLAISLDAYEWTAKTLSQVSVSEQVSSTDLRACLQALQAKAQSWTSYSNSRQHAAVICDVSRSEIMKGEALNLFHLLTGLGSQTMQALHDALQRATSQQEEAHIAFAEALTDLHAAQLQDVARIHDANKAVIEETGSQAIQAAHRTGEVIGSVGMAAVNLKQLIETIFLSAATGGAELASRRLQDAEANHEMALALKQVVHHVATNDLSIVRESLRGAAEMAVGS